MSRWWRGRHIPAAAVVPLVMEPTAAEPAPAAGKTAGGKAAGGKGYPPPVKAAGSKGAPSPPKGAGKAGGRGYPTPKPKPKGDPKKDWEKLQRIKQHKDEKYSQEIEDVDLSQIDESARRNRTKCPRCEKEIDEEYFQSHWDAHSTELLPWLYLGAYRNTQDEKELTVRTGITHILNVAGGECSMHEEIKMAVEAYNTERGLGFEYIKYNFTDTKDMNLLQQLDEVLAIMESRHAANPENHVLVHCVQGISRSASVVIAYLMKAERMGLREAYDYVKKRRSVADPRPEFLDQLGAFEKKLFGTSQPSLTSEEIFAGRHMLNLDAPPVPTHGGEAPIGATPKPAEAPAASRAEAFAAEAAGKFDMGALRTILDKLEKAAEQLTPEPPPRRARFTVYVDDAVEVATVDDFANLVQRIECAVEKLLGKPSTLDMLTERLEKAVGRLERAAAEVAPDALSSASSEAASAANWAAKLQTLLRRIEDSCGPLLGASSCSSGLASNAAQGTRGG